VGEKSKRGIASSGRGKRKKTGALDGLAKIRRGIIPGLVSGRLQGFGLRSFSLA